MCWRACYVVKFRVVLAIVLSWSFYTCQETSLEEFKTLDLSRNNLSGKTTDFFVDSNSWQILNLYYKNFEGMVPIHGFFLKKFESVESKKKSTSNQSSRTHIYIGFCVCLLI